MITTPIVSEILQRQRVFYQSGITRDIAFREHQLKALLRTITDSEVAILEALKTDLGKPGFEAYASEVGLVRAEIKYVLAHLRSWARPRRMPVHITQLPSTVWSYPEPYGVTLIIAPWNYPLLLLIAPLVGALAAGNCSILKPSELAPCSSALVARMMAQTFDPGLVTVVEGGPETAEALLAEQFDYIFYTGSSRVGRIVMQAAAQYLTPVTLELGGKSPCIVDADADIEAAAKRIVWGKCFNAGQICIAPDYVLVDERIKLALIEAMQRALRQYYNGNTEQSPDYSRIVNAGHFQRLCALLPHGGAGDQSSRQADTDSPLLAGGTQCIDQGWDGVIVAGGETNAATLYIAPTIIDSPSPDSALMQDEIFGPLLPVLPVQSLDEAIAFINARPKPLALYHFTRNGVAQERVLRETSCGGGCINDVLVHFSSPYLSFGGVGASGFGKYRGRAGFDTFTHEKTILKRSALFDIWFRYAPYKHSYKITKWLM